MATFVLITPIRTDCSYKVIDNNAESTIILNTIPNSKLNNSQRSQKLQQESSEFVHDFELGTSLYHRARRLTYRFVSFRRKYLAYDAMLANGGDAQTIKTLGVGC